MASATPSRGARACGPARATSSTRRRAARSRSGARRAAGSSPSRPRARPVASQSRYVEASAVSVELRGAGASLPRGPQLRRGRLGFEADRLIAVEVLTPGGNWGSYPPHKHDEVREGETELEEIYHYVVADGPSGPGLAYQHVYGTADRPIEVLTTVRTGDVVLVPHGWHGPAMAAPGYDLYYLNVMAGPGERAWRACDDPAHAWVKDAWRDAPVDPRLPFGRTG